MKNTKPVCMPLANHFKLSKRLCPTTEGEKEHMESVPYSSIVGTLMYATVCAQPNISQVMDLVSRYLSDTRKEHWEAVK